MGLIGIKMIALGVILFVLTPVAAVPLLSRNPKTIKIGEVIVSAWLLLSFLLLLTGATIKCIGY